MRIIDLATWERKELFLFFRDFDNPTWDISADVRITRFYELIKKAEQSFFLSFLYVASKTCNQIPALRQRIIDHEHVVEYDLVHPGSTILYENGTFGFGYFHLVPGYLLQPLGILILKEQITQFPGSFLENTMKGKESDGYL
jgi:chloramphenicol O-acetyltransferase type A